MPELSNVYRPDRSMVQTVPGAGNPTAAAVPQSSAYGLDPNLLARLIAARQAQQRPAAMPAAYAQAPMRRGADMDEAFTQFMPDPTPKRKEPETRMRRVRNRTVLPVYGMDPAGFTYDDVQETKTSDGWSGDALYGTLGGNEAAARQRMATIDRRESLGNGPGGGIADAPFPIPRESEHDQIAKLVKMGASPADIARGAIQKGSR